MRKAEKAIVPMRIRRKQKNLRPLSAGHAPGGELNPDLNVAVRKAKGIYYCQSVKTPATLTDDKLAFSSVNNVYTYGMGSTYGTDAKIKRIPGKDWLKTTQLKGKGASAQFLFGDVNDHGMNGDITQGPMLQVWANDSKLRTGNPLYYRDHFHSLVHVGREYVLYPALPPRFQIPGRFSNCLESRTANPLTITSCRFSGRLWDASRTLYGYLN